MENFKDPIQEETFDIKEFIYKTLAYWYLFALAISIALCIAFILNKTTTPIYEVKSSILIQKEQPLQLDAQFSLGLSLYSSTYRLFNEIGILKSFTLTQRALRHLDFSIGYYSYENFSERELYKKCPFKFLIDSGSLQPINLRIKLKILSPAEFEIEANADVAMLYNFLTNKVIDTRNDYSVNYKGRINEPFFLNYLGGSIIPNNCSDFTGLIGKTFYFKIFDQSSLISQFRGYKVDDSKNSSIITVYIQGSNVEKQVDFLNALSKEFLIKDLEKKNSIADNTIRFIDSQLGDVTDSLYFSEKRLQEYRASNTIMNVDFQTQQVFVSLDNLQNQRAELVVKSKYYDYLKNYLNQNKDGQDLVAPSSIGIQDPVLSNLISDLINLTSEKSELSLNLKRDNPMLSSVEMRIKNMKNTIFENLENLYHATIISLQDIDQRINNFSRVVNKMPETERKLFGFERKFKLNDALYTYLLTKRSEVQIAKASYVPDNEILDIARETEYKVITPKTFRNYIIALILGFGIPIAFLLLRDFFNDKILVSEDIEKVTDFPILGYILHNKEKSFTIVADDPLSISSESIRAVRTNFQFIGKENDKNVVLITSSMMNEGKTFISLNLALSFALNSKKTILLNFDLRKPKVQDYLNIENKKGLSLYLSGNAEIEEIIVKTPYENLDVILAGTIPPNPMELIAGNKTSLLIEKLKEKYEYIILDSPPIGMVADSMLLIKHANILLYIVRQNQTLKKVFTHQIEDLQKKGIQNVNIILNDIQMGKRYQSYSYGYAYAYGYGYGYGYKEESGKKRKKKKSDT